MEQGHNWVLDLYVYIHMMCLYILYMYMYIVRRFIGSTEFAPGKWVGVELEEGQAGKNNGVVNGKEYFKCSGNRGLFVRSSQLQVSLVSIEWCYVCMYVQCNIFLFLYVCTM